MHGDDTTQEYADLPFELQVSFIYLDCLCGGNESENCCDGEFECQQNIEVVCAFCLKC